MSAAAPDSASLQRHIVVLVYPDVMAMDVCGPMEAFSMANAYAKRGLYRLSITAATTDPVKTSVGFCIVPNCALADLEGPIDTLLVAGGFGYSAAFRDSAVQPLSAYCVEKLG